MNRTALMHEPTMTPHRDDTVIQRPIFLVGSERSGTTLLRIMLDHHPRIAFQLESEYLVETLPDEGGFTPLSEYYDHLETSRVFQHSRLKIDRSLDYVHLANSFLIQKMQRVDKPIVGATVHFDFDKLLRIWPEAVFIHLIRDGRDVSRSVVGMGWAGNLYHATRIWLEAEHTWDRLKPKLKLGQSIDVYYEQLLQDPVGVLTTLCRFIGVDYHPAMLEYMQDSTYDYPDPSLAYQWKRKFSDRDLELVESQIADMLVARGYELSSVPRIKVGWIRRKWLVFHSRVGRAWFRIGRYGLALYVANFLARRLHIRPWRRSTQLAMNEIDEQHLK